MTQTALPDIIIHGQAYPDRGYCYREHEWAPTVHTKWCPFGDGWGDVAVESSQCIKPGQDGARIAADRESTANRLRFTPPEYRPIPYEPGPVIEFNAKQPMTRLVLRGRARGTQEWSTWETYIEPLDRSFTGTLRSVTQPERPREMNVDEARAIVAEFTRRCPAYEFKIVRAEVSVVETDLA